MTVFFRNLPIGVLFLSTVLVLASFDESRALSVIPDGQGFGMETPAGRGGQIIRVTNLNSKGKGSLKAAIDTRGPRVVVFEIAGNIEIKGRLKINNPFITIAGQTAPSPGITLKKCTLTINTHDVFIQHLRIRTGDLEGITPDTRDAVTIGLTQPKEELYNIVIDHCSISWAIDENIGSSTCSNVTWRNCIISEALGYSLHSKGEHSKGMLITNAGPVSIIGNIFAHARDRNPVIQSNVQAVLVNNLIFNPGDFNIRISCLKNKSDVSIVGNVVIGGKDTHRSARARIPCIWKNPKEGTRIYLQDNQCSKGTQTVPTDWSLVRNATRTTTKKLKKMVAVKTPPVWVMGLNPLPSHSVKAHLVASAGARPLDRDKVDRRIIENIRTGEGRIIDTPSAVGGWPALEEHQRKLVIPANPHSDDNADGYTNLEEWLHDLSKNLEGTGTPQ